MNLVLSGNALIIQCIALTVLCFLITQITYRVKKPALCVMLISYTLIVLYLTWFSRSMGSEPVVKLIPGNQIIRAFESYEKSKWSSVRILAYLYFNFLMLMPLGSIIAAYDSKRFIIPLGLGFLSTLLIETVQFTLFLGEFDIDDIISNLLGCLLAWTFTSLCIRLHDRNRTRKANMLADTNNIETS